MSMGSTGATSAHPSEECMSKPLWNYVTKFEKINDGGGNVSWQCNFCNKVAKSSYTRVRAHLLRLPSQGIRACPRVTAEDISEMRILEEEARLRSSHNVPSTSLVPLPSVSMGGMSTFVQDDESKKRKTSTNSSGSRNENLVEMKSDMVSRDELDAEIARMFYSAGLPFQLTRNPYYLSSFKLATSGSIPGYVPPGSKMLMTTLLQKEKENINKLLQTNRWRWKDNGVSIISDGWSDLEKGPLINFMAVTDGMPVFLKVVDCSGERKDKFFIANVIKEVINEVGHENVVQVITDNSPNCKGAGELIEDQFPNISWTPCVVHTLNLALKIICESKNVENSQLVNEECRWILDIVGEVMQIKNFVINHPMRSEIFNELATLKLLCVADTRFAPVVIMLKRFRLIKHGLLCMAISERWPSYREVDVEKAKFVRGKLINDNWWDSIDYILSFTSPIYDMLRACNMDKPCLHLVYDMWDTMIEKVKKAIYRHERKKQEESSTFYNMVYQTLVDGWNKNNTPLHCLAHSLNPRYYTDEWLQEDPSRVPPHKDSEVSRERMKYLKKCFPTSEERAKVNIEYAKFSTMAEDFKDSDSIINRYLLDPKSWWILYGSFAPVLQTLAMKLLGQPSSSSCCERNWSFYSFMQSVRKNIASQRVQDLIYVHNNLRLLSRRTPEYLLGETKMWDISGDAFDLCEDAGMLEIANLSLDEPELEAMVIASDCM